MDQPRWLAEAWAELGQREVSGSADNARIRAFFRDVGQPASARRGHMVRRLCRRLSGTRQARLDTLADGAVVFALGCHRR